MLATSFQLITRLRHFATHAMWLVCVDILKIVNWKCAVSVIIHKNSSLSSGSRYCKPEIISCWKVSITVFTCVFCPRLIRNVGSRRRFDNSSIIAPSIQRESSLNVMPRIRHISISYSIYTYIYIYIDMDITLSISDIYISSTWDYITFEGFCSMLKKCFSKVGRSVISWRSG